MWEWVAVWIVTGLVAVLLIWYCQHRWVPTLSPEMLAPITPDSYFSFSQDPAYQKRVEDGKKLASTKKLLVCGLIRNRNNRIPQVRRRVDFLSRYFGQVAVLVVENDSQDQTRLCLLKWSEEAPYKVEVLGCKPNVCKCHLHLPETVGHDVDEQRLEKMAILRNKYVTRLRQLYSHFDLVLVWDLDTMGSLYVDGVLSSVSDLHHSDYDALCANGMYVWPGLNAYYDTFAHSEPWLDQIGLSLGHNTLPTRMIKSLSTKTWDHQPLHQVTSCFSGATLYKIKVFLKNKYETKNLRCEHDSISKGVKMAVNQHMVNYILRNE
jgi:hypothetical protein